MLNIAVPASLTSLQVLINFFNGSVIATKLLIGRGEKTVSRFFDDVETSLSSVIKDPRYQPNDSDASPAMFQIAFGAFSWVFHNPIAQKLMEYNPLAFATRAAEEGISEALDELGADFKLPSFDLEPVLATINKFIEKEGDQLQKFMKLLSEIVPKIIETPSKALDILGEIAAGGLWTLLEAARNLVVDLMELVMASLDVVLKLINQVIKLDWISDLWDDFTGVPFTMLNLFTWPVAAIWNLVSLVLTGEFPFGSDGKAGYAGLMDEILAWYGPDTTAASVQPRTLRTEPTAVAAGATARSGEAGEPQPRAAGMDIRAPDEEPDEKSDHEKYAQIISNINFASQVASCVAGFAGFWEAVDSPSDSEGESNATEMTRLTRKSPVAKPSPPLISPKVLKGIHFFADVVTLGGRVAGMAVNEIYLTAAPAGTLSAEDIRISRARNYLPCGTALLDFGMRFATVCLVASKKIPTDGRKPFEMACEGTAGLSQLSCIIDNIMAITPSAAPNFQAKVAYVIGAVGGGGGTVANASQAIIIDGGKNDYTAISALFGNFLNFLCSLLAVTIANLP